MRLSTPIRSTCSPPDSSLTPPATSWSASSQAARSAAWSRKTSPASSAISNHNSPRDMAPPQQATSQTRGPAPACRPGVGRHSAPKHLVRRGTSCPTPTAIACVHAVSRIVEQSDRAPLPRLQAKQTRSRPARSGHSRLLSDTMGHDEARNRLAEGRDDSVAQAGYRSTPSAAVSRRLPQRR